MRGRDFKSKGDSLGWNSDCASFKASLASPVRPLQDILDAEPPLYLTLFGLSTQVKGMECPRYLGIPVKSS
jgi:hypothetical protein